MLQFKIGDKVRHKATDIKGKVIGYGCRETEAGDRLTTLQVELPSQGSIKPVAEDLCDRWKPWGNRRILACTLPYPPISFRKARKVLHS
ncbi:MAG: hypothetical protein AAGE96_11860 [Cyanobacteria bacterium P01_G01_bin.19]